MTTEEYESKLLFLNQKMEELRLKQESINQSIKSLNNSLEALTRSYKEFNPDRREKLLLSQASLDVAAKLRQKQRDSADVGREMISRIRQKRALTTVYLRR